MHTRRYQTNNTFNYLIFPVMLLCICAFQSAEHVGNWFATINKNTVDIRFTKSGDRNRNDNSNSVFRLTEFKNFAPDKFSDFSLTREAGTVYFHGKFNGKSGSGTYRFSPDKSFRGVLIKEGIESNGQDDSWVFFMVNLKKSYISMLKRQGFTDLTKDDLIPLAALNVDEGFIKSIKAGGFSGFSLKKLIPLKALGVDQSYIDELKKSGYKDLSLDQLISLKSQGINGDFLRQSRTKGQKPSVEEIMAMKALNVDEAYRAGFKQIKFVASDEDLISMKSLGITPEFVTAIRRAGFVNVKTDEVISMKALGINIAEINAYKKLGFSNLSIDDVISAKATGVTPAYILNMKKKGHNFNTIDKYVEAKSTSGGLD